jgi:hypothetical protein
VLVSKYKAQGPECSFAYAQCRVPNYVPFESRVYGPFLCGSLRPTRREMSNYHSKSLDEDDTSAPCNSTQT